MRIHFAAAVFLASLSNVAAAQVPASARLIFPGESDRTGVFRLQADSLDNQVQAELLDAEGRRLNPARCIPSWRSADPSVLAIGRISEGNVWVRALNDGITELTATFPCNAGLNRAVTVVVGSAAIDRPFSPPAEGARFYPKELKVTLPGFAYVFGGKVFIRPIDTSTQFVAAARNAEGELITPDEFPMRWTVSDPSVLKIEKAYDHTAFFTPTGTGTTTITFSVEGLRQSFDVTVQDAFPPNADDFETLAVRTSTASAVNRAALTNVPITVKPAPTVPITVRPAPTVPITVKPAPTVPITVRPAPTVPITVKPATASGAAPGAGSRMPVTQETQPPSRVPPVPATGLIAIAGTSSVQLKWTPAPGAVGYRITRQAVGTNETVTITGQTVGADGTGLVTYPEYTDSPLDPSKQYVFTLATYYRDSDGTYYFPDASTEARATARPREATTVSGVQGWTLEYDGGDRVVVKYIDRRYALEKLLLLRAKAGYLDQFAQIAELPAAETRSGNEGVYVDQNLPMNQGFAYKIRQQQANGTVIGETDVKDVWIASRPKPGIRDCVATRTSTTGRGDYSVRFLVDPAPQAKALTATIIWKRPGTFTLQSGYGNNGYAAEIKKVNLPPGAGGTVTFEMSGAGVMPDTYYASARAIYDNGGAVPAPIARMSFIELSPYAPTPEWSGCTVTK